MQSLFHSSQSDSVTLAVRMRPGKIEEFVGQEHLLGENKILKRAIDADKIVSLIIYGPPGTGKTALATIIQHKTKAHFVRVNAVASNVSELREILKQANHRLHQGLGRTLLFIDEIHRFNKAQQDILLPDIEGGNPILIAATTHNPFFVLTPPLISRSLVCEFKSLSEEDILKILKRALEDKKKGLGKSNIIVDKEVLCFFAKVSDGDARRALNALEIACLTTKKNKQGFVKIDLNIAQDSIQKKAVLYDKDEDGHYNTISAFIKSMRGTDPDATLYWLAKMIYAGEDPRFIARRILIAASEDVGNADPRALQVAQAACYAVEYLGMPEARIPLAQAAVYIASAPKSNAAYEGIEKALEDIKEGKTLEVPKHLKDTHYQGAKKLGHGEGYKYPHSYQGGWVKQNYLSKDVKYYFPKNIGYEKKIQEFLKQLEELAK
ncbi:MAG: replication-associated recombination protein A [Candidatus Saelkia tenebricola]|nr:replication-associated recombination protein A [Candidatus Saelkia tenebricola]